MTDTATDHPFAPLFAAKKQLKAAKGQLLLTPGEEPKGVLYIHDGYLKAYDIDTRGCNQIIALYGPGDLFPLAWALKSVRPHLFYEAISPLAFSICPQEEFNAAIQDDISLLHAVITSLLRAYQHFQQRIQNLELGSARQKVVFRLLFLANRFGFREKDGISIAMPIRYQDLAESLNMTRDTVNRVMRELASEGYVTHDSRSTTIIQPGPLFDVLGADTTLKF